MTALSAYPFIVEPYLGAAFQSRLWFAGYAGLMLMFVLTVAALYQRHWKTIERTRTEAVDVKTRLYWIAAAFVPSGLMLAVTSHIAANIGSVPFLWLVPLALYLLTFIFAFARRFHSSSPRVSRLMPVALLAVFPLIAAGVDAQPGLNWIVIERISSCSIAALCLPHAVCREPPRAAASNGILFWIALWRA
jgi:hypothetical protein